MAADPVTSALTADLERLYTQAERRLALIVRAGLNRGLDPTRLGTDRQRRGDSTLAYRERQRQQAEAILASLRARTTGATTGIVAGAYNAGVVTVDRTVGPDLRLRGEFGRVHVAAVEQLAGNLEQSLHAAADKVGEHIATVFERAQAVEGALREGHNPATHVGVRFIGRRVDDAYRTATLEELAEATIGLDTRRQASAMLARRLVTDGLSDGLTALVDAGGRRWGLGEYAEMAARTTTAEAVSQGTLGRLEEGGLDLVAITSHPHQADVCTPFDGKTFSRSGTDPRYPPLTSTPPFHPRAVLGGQRIEAPGGVVAATRAVYSGPAVEIQGAAGVRATVSPNHPVLTARGWLPARLLREGDEVLRPARRDGAPGPGAGEHFDNMPPVSAEVFNSVGAAGASARTVASAEDLHGDARFCQREVDVVWTDRMLRDGGHAAVLEQAGEAVLVGASMQAALLTGPSPSGVLGVRCWPAVARPLPDDYATRSEASAERRVGEWASERELLARSAVEVTTDELIEVRYLDRWHGFAYDFETTAGTYFVGSLYVHNCRHRVAPATANLDDYEARLAQAARERGVAIPEGIAA